MPAAGRILAAAVLALAAAGRPGAAAQEGPTGAPPPGKIVIRAGDALLWQEDGREVILMTGQFSVDRSDFSVSGARAMAWKVPGSQRPLDEIYAEGNVTLRQGNQRIQAERLWVDFGTGRAMIVDLRGQAFSESHKQTFYLRAREARMLMMGRLEASDIQISTCSYGVPHYHLEVGTARLTGRNPRTPDHPFEIWPFRDWRFRAEDVYPEFTGAPFFFLPGLALGPWIREFPIRSLRYGESSRFGHFLYSEFGLKIKRGGDEQHKPHTWGDVVLEADWREKRGGAAGLDLEYSWNRYHGYVDTYALHDFGRDLDIDFERKFPPLKREERGRIRAFHRTDLSDHWRVEAEAWYFSDRSLQEEFFEKEFKEDKEPETAGYLRWMDGPLAAYVYERHRLNDFQTQNEYLPRLDFCMIPVPPVPGFLDNLTLTERFDLVHLRRRFDEDLHVPSSRTWRMEADTELLLPWDLGPLQLSPFARQRTSLYEHDADGDREARSIWTGGGRVSTQIHGTHPDVAWEAVGLRGVRHVMELEARYADSAACTLDPSELYPYEDSDRMDEFREWSFEMRHRFKTRDAENRAFEFLNVGLEFEYYPRPGRDTAGARVDNILPPFNWITLAPGPEGYPRRDLSNFHYDLTLQPRDFIRLGLAGEYNPETRHEEVREGVVAVSPAKGITAYVAHAYVRGLTNAYTYGASWEITEKWKVSASVQYDYRVHAYVSQDLVVGRDFHDFVVEAVFERDFGRDESRFHVAFVPKFFSRPKSADDPGRTVRSP